MPARDDQQPPGRRLPSMEDEYGPVVEVFAALASPVRAAIVHRLTERPQTVADLVEHLGASQPLVSQHLSRLKHAGLVAGERRGRHVVHRIADEHVAHVFLDALRHSREVHEPA